jgi:predicted PurR-regulated permease PerM
MAYGKQESRERDSVTDLAMNAPTGEHRHAPDSTLASRDRLRAFVMLAITVLGLLVCYLLMVPFLPALTWAMALAVLFAPAHRWVESNVKSNNLAAAISVVAIGLLVLVPITLLSSQLIAEAAKGAIAMKEKVASSEWRRAMEGPLAPIAVWIQQMDLPAMIDNVVAWLAKASTALARGWMLELITLLVTFYLLFYFLRDRKVVLDWFEQVLPFSAAEMSRLFTRIGDTVHATVYGTVAVGVLQGTLGGLMFWWLGLPAPLLWGLIMGVLALIPVLGAFVVWLPAAIFLAAEGSWVKALILSGWGAIVIGGIDNLLYPILVGDRMRLHTVPAFVSIVGGVILFGPSGVLLGPLAVTVTVFALEIWRIRIRPCTPAA